MDHIRLHVNYVVKLKGIGYVGISAHQHLRAGRQVAHEINSRSQ